MTIENSLIIDLWGVVKDSIPTKDREEAAYQFLTVFCDYGCDYASLKDIMGDDDILDRALREIRDEEDDDDDHSMDSSDY